MPISLTVTLNDDGTVSVDGPVDNKLLCLGLLGVAHDAVYDYAAQKANRITPAFLMPPNGTKQ